MTLPLGFFLGVRSNNVIATVHSFLHWSVDTPVRLDDYDRSRAALGFARQEEDDLILRAQRLRTVAQLDDISAHIFSRSFSARRRSGYTAIAHAKGLRHVSIYLSHIYTSHLYQYTTLLYIIQSQNISFET